MLAQHDEFESNSPILNMSTTLNENSSSSEDDEVLGALREATDSQFLNESLFNADTDNDNIDERKKPEEECKLPKTLRRRTSECTETSNDFGVTQDFKNFVAKELAKSLDKSLKEDEREEKEKVARFNDIEPNKKNRGHDTPSIGIKLMRDSKEFISVFDGDDSEVLSNHSKKRKGVLRMGDNFAEHMFKCQEVAVEPDWVLSKVGTSVWTEKQKGGIYRYKKLDNGSLAEID